MITYKGKITYNERNLLSTEICWKHHWRVYFGKKDIEQSNNEQTRKHKIKRVGNLNKDYSLEISNSTWEIRGSGSELKLPIVLIIFKRQQVKNLRVQNRIDSKLSKGVESKEGNRKKFWSVQKMLGEKKKKRQGWYKAQNKNRNSFRYPAITINVKRVNLLAKR